MEWKPEMKRIVCATRAGAASRRAQKRAISLAKEHSAELIFLYAADARAYGAMSPELAKAVEDELTRMGRSLLHIARVRAQEQGVDAGMATRCGPVRQAIMDFVSETQADVVVIGAPRLSLNLQEFGESGVHSLIEEVTQTTGAEVVIV